MDLKALARLLDSVYGQNMELGLCVERMEVREMILLGPFTFFAHSSLLSSQYCEGALYWDWDPKQGQRVDLTLWGPFKPCSAPQNLQACQFSVKSYRQAFPMILVRCPLRLARSGSVISFLKSRSRPDYYFLILCKKVRTKELRTDVNDVSCRLGNIELRRIFQLLPAL
jgi:hypothetical protein